MSESTTIEVRGAPTQRPTVSVRPAAAAAVNAAAAAGEAVFAVGGGPVLAAVAAGAVAVPAAMALRRAKAKQAAAKRTRGSTSGSRSSGHGLGSRPGRVSSGGGATGPRGGGRLRNPFTGRGGGLKSPGGGRSAGNPSRAGTPGRSSSAAAPKSGPGALRRAMGKLRNRDNGRALEKNKKTNQPGVPRRVARTLLPGLTTIARWLRDKIRRKPRAAEPVTGKKKPKVATDIREPNPPGSATKPTTDPAPTANPGGRLPVPGADRPDPTTGGTMADQAAPSAMTRMLDLIETDMAAIARNYDPAGMLDVIDEYARWPDVQRALSKVWEIMHAKAEEYYPLKPAAAGLVAAIGKHQIAVANAAEVIAPTIRSLHRQQIEALDDSRNAMWDHRANGRPVQQP